jgi:hypothetical protein
MSNPLKIKTDTNDQPLEQTEQKDVIKKDKKIRQRQTEEQLDKTLKDSFPASDPPSSY